MRYITGSRSCMFSCAMSIFARSTREPSGNSPARILSNRPRFSATLRLRNGDSTPGVLKDPRVAEMVSPSWSST